MSIKNTGWIEWRGMVLIDYYPDGSILTYDFTGEIPCVTVRKVGQKK
jgi:hypothetical protein